MGRLARVAKWGAGLAGGLACLFGLAAMVDDPPSDQVVPQAARIEFSLPQANTTLPMANMALPLADRADLINTTTPPDYHLGVSEADLLKVEARNGGRPFNFNKADYQRGLTADVFRGQILIDAIPVQTPDGWTATVQRAHYRLGYSLDVYVVNFPEGSCERSAVLKHENIHVANKVNTLAAMLPSFKTALEDAVLASDKVSFTGQTAAQATQAAADFLSVALGPVNKKLLAEVESLDEALDSQESYKRTDDECPVWHNPPEQNSPPINRHKVGLTLQANDCASHYVAVSCRMENDRRL